MKKVTSSAPGKLMLLGEHAVVYNHPCLVTAVNQRMKVSVELVDGNEFILNAPDVKIESYKKQISDLGEGNIPKGAKFVEIAVRNVLGSIGKTKALQNTGLKIATKSEFSSQFGFGTSSASTVCVVKAMSELLNLKFTNKQIFDISYKTVLDIQGKGSGFDIAAAVYGGILYFYTAGKKIEPLNVVNLPLVVGYSGIKADTVTLMTNVNEKFKDKDERLGVIYLEIENLVENAKMYLLDKNFEKFGEMMNKNQILLKELGVSFPKLDNMINGANTAGAYGAKLSGAGGGDCMIAVCSVSSKNKVEEGIKNAGGEVINVKPNAQGVRIEN